MIIAQISDTHIDVDGATAAARLGYLQRCVDDINHLDPQPDVVVHTGDLAHNGTPTDYREIARILCGLRAPFHVLAGNRDDRAALRAAFPAEHYLLPDTDFVQYRVEDYPVRLMALDTVSGHTNKGDFCEVRADSLRAALAEDATKPTVIFMHHPPFEVRESDYPMQFVSPEAIARIGDALSDQRQVVGAFCGHTHRFSAGTIAEVPVSSMPSVAVDLRLGDYPDDVQTTPLYRIHRFDPPGGFVSETRAAGQHHAPAGNAE